MHGGMFGGPYCVRSKFVKRNYAATVAFVFTVVFTLVNYGEKKNVSYSV